MVRPHDVLAERELLPRLVEEIDGRLPLHLQAEHAPDLHDVVVEEEVVPVERHRDAEGALRLAHTGDVVDVRVGEQDVPDGQVAAASTMAMRSATSSPGSTTTASRVSSHPSTNPFLKKGAQALASMIME